MATPTRHDLLKYMMNARSTQRGYFRTPTKPNMEFMRSAERKADKMLQEMQAKKHKALEGERMKEITDAWEAMRKAQNAYWEFMTLPRRERAEAKEKVVDTILLTIKIREPQPEPQQMEIDLGGHA